MRRFFGTGSFARALIDTAPKRTELLINPGAPGVSPMDAIQVVLTLLDIADATASACSLVALGELGLRLARAFEDQTAFNSCDIERCIELARTHTWHH